jgi:hypothetical protein
VVRTQGQCARQVVVHLRVPTSSTCPTSPTGRVERCTMRTS